MPDRSVKAEMYKTMTAESGDSCMMHSKNFTTQKILNSKAHTECNGIKLQGYPQGGQSFIISTLHPPINWPAHLPSCYIPISQRELGPKT